MLSQIAVVLLAAAIAPAGEVELGRRLFSDRRLSRDGTVACATCHDPERAFADGLRVARGIGQAEGTRRVPTLINRGLGTSFFWDGRAATLEEQVLQPILNPREMGMTMELAMDRLRADREYARAFGRRIEPQDLASALASYVRSIRSMDSSFDRYVAGQKGTLTPDEEAGAILFSSKANCWFCHSGENFTDEQFHNTGVGWKDGRAADEGRFLITHDPADRGAFKTPTLREVARRSPYMHDGSVATLEEVVENYDRGGMENPALDPALKPLHLTAEEKRSLVAFLRALSGTIR